MDYTSSNNISRNLNPTYSPENKREDISKSFSSLIGASYQSPNTRRNHFKSIESPYTSLGSSYGSYVTVEKETHGLYDTLKAKAEKANAVHESKSKAVMEALKNLQDKIQRLEEDRTQAERNLKSLASETNDYKDLLKHQQNVSASPLADSKSKELEDQLENAQSRCTVLEKQLESMRSMMKNQKINNDLSRRSSRSNTAEKSHKNVQESRFTFPDFTAEHSIPQRFTSDMEPTKLKDSPALEKIMNLEKQHIRLTASQNFTESKIRDLEEKIQEERHHRKMLQNKSEELQYAMKIKQDTGKPPPVFQEKEKDVQIKRKIKKRKTSSKTAAIKPKELTTKNRPDKISSPEHYLLDLTKIPFVVGQSTSKSHSLGANIQNILSIMKSHNNLCSTQDKHVVIEPSFSSTTVSKDPKVTRSSEDLKQLLTTLQDEFAILGFEHREIKSQLSKTHRQGERYTSYEAELEDISKKMEAKSKQIDMIKEHINAHVNKSRKKSQSKTESQSKNHVKLKGQPQEVEVVTTIRTKGNSKHAVPQDINNRAQAKREMLQKVQKLQTTLRKDDLKWI